jgi:hypothetical protein
MEARRAQVHPDTLAYTVWEEMLASQMRALYFGELVSRYQRLDRMLGVALLILTSGAAATILSRLPDAFYWITASLATASAAVSAWRLLGRYADYAARAADLHLQWNHLAADYEGLWNNLYADNAEARLAELQARGRELSKASTQFPAKKRMLIRWWDYVSAQNLAKYGSRA